jgi:hypothetical protein
MCCLAVEYKANSLPGRGQYRPPLPRMSPAKRTSVGLCMAVVCSLMLAGVASAAPAGDEYLPKVPNATGHSGSGAGGGGSTATGSSSAAPSETGGTAAGTAATSDQESKHKKGSKDDQRVTPVASTDGGSSDGGDGSSGLLIGLLIVAGVIIAAVGMTLRQRGGGDEAEGAGPAREGGADQGARPTTPDGEIVAGRDKA